MNSSRRWLLVIILIAFALRLTRLGHQSLWYDEGITWLLAQKSLADLIHWTAADIQPPFYYLLLWAAKFLFGSSEWALRFPSALFNTLTLPLIYILARRLFRRLNFPHSPLAALSSPEGLAVIIFALSPLMVYYSQEARMYTLLVFEVTLAGYLLLKIVHLPGGSSSSFIFHPSSFILVAAAALYTHYFSAFLLAAYGLYIGLVLWQRHWPKMLVIQSLLLFGLTALLFVPWLPVLLSRLGDDPSYWPGALKLSEALRKVLISFTAGETVFEQTAWWLAGGYIAILVFGGVYTGIQKLRFWTPQRVPSPSSFLPSSFSLLFLWLILPIASILILSYQSPKFNPRYTLLAYPAFVLLFAAAVSQIANRKSQTVLRFTLYAFLFSASIFSLYNWFTVGDFAKADFKHLAKFVQERQAADETVLLSSGHMFPVWAYYYGWQNWTPLPSMERLDVRRVTGLGIAGDIARATNDKGGVWLVRWQDEVIDPNGVVPFWLDQIGRRPLDAGDFWGVGLEHWRLDPDKINSLYENPVKQPSLNNFANQVDLLGLTQLSDTEIALFWRPRQPLPDDLVISLNLSDPDGFEWDSGAVVGRPGAYMYPPSRWPVGQITMTRHRLPWRWGTPPGDYQVEIGVGQILAQNFNGWDILDEQGRPRRRTTLLGPVNLSRPVQPEDTAQVEKMPPLVDLSPLVTVQSGDLSPKGAEPGDRARLTLVWQAGTSNRDDLAVSFKWLDAAGQTFPAGAGVYSVPSRDFPLSRWQPGEVVVGQYWLNIPPNAAPGPATLQLQLNPVSGDARIFAIDRLEILPTQRNFTLPTSVNMPLNADFSGQTTLLGADCSTWDGAACPAAPGQTITLTLYWRAETASAVNYTIFTHLLGTGETVALNADHAPAKPTQAWVKDEIVADTVNLTIPATLPPGRYAIEVGLYNAADPAYPRLPLSSGDTRVILPQPLTVE